MKVVLADDEPLARDRLRRLLGELPGYELVGEAADGEQLQQLVQNSRPDIVLLDIHMPGCDGLQAARALAALPLAPSVIFTTAYSEHALSAFDTAASAYLLKPVSRAALAEALHRAQQPRRAQLAGLEESLEDGGMTRSTTLVVNTARSQQRVSALHVACCLADQKLTRVIHEHGEGWCDSSLQELEQLLEQGFLRVHRKALISKRHLQRLVSNDRENCVYVRHHAEPIPVSRRRLPELRKLLRHSD